MKAAVFEAFGKPIQIQNVAEPTPPDDGVVVKVEATGICRSDWHAWRGDTPFIHTPHVLGHEFAGRVEEIGKNVKNWKRGDRVTLPIGAGCGICYECITGNHQLCENRHVPGFTEWGSYAEYVPVSYADVNLIRIPESIDSVTAASLGCRFVTSFRAVVNQGVVRGGQWVSIFGCGGIGLSAIMIASAIGANVVAIDIADEKLEFARSIGATAVVNSKSVKDTPEAVREITKGGSHVSIDALGSQVTLLNSLLSLRKHGKHIQVGIMPKEQENPSIPMGLIGVKELEIIGNMGVQPHLYPQVFEMISAGKVLPQKLIGKRISLGDTATAITDMDTFRGVGVTVVDRF